MNKKGFTLIELLLVISIVGVLAALTLIGLKTVRARARDVGRKSDIISLSRCVFSHSLDNGEAVPLVPNGEFITEQSKIGSALLSDRCITTIPQNVGFLGDDLMYTYKTFADSKTFKICGKLEASINYACATGGYSSSGGGGGDDNPVIKIVPPGDNDGSPIDPTFVKIQGVLNHEEMGMNVVNVGDQDGDGIDDFASGAPHAGYYTSGVLDNTSNKGAVYIYSSSDYHLIKMITGLDNDIFKAVGRATYAFDFNNDTKKELVITSGFSDKVYVYSNGGGTLLKTFTCPGSGSNHSFGSSLSMIPDIDSDGYNDLVISDSGEGDFKGAIYFISYSTGNAIKTIWGATDERFGISAVVNYQGNPSIAAGSSYTTNAGKLNAGRLSIYSITGGTSPLVTIYGSQTDSKIWGKPMNTSNTISDTLILAESINNIRTYYIYNPTTNQKTLIPANISHTDVSEIGDFNSDGTVEYVTYDYTNPQQHIVSIYKLNGDKLFESPSFIDVCDSAILYFDEKLWIVVGDYGYDSFNGATFIMGVPTTASP